MERRDFILKTSLLTAFGGLTQSTFAGNFNGNDHIGINPFLLPALPPLAHNGNMTVRTWVKSGMTNGIYSNVECAVAPKLMGPPPHYHKELDELMYVAEGTATILIGDDIVEVKAGGWHMRPRMIKHTFWNAADTSLRFYDMYFNQPFEEYLEQIFNEITAEKGYPEGSEKKNQAIGNLNEKFGLVFDPTSFEERQKIVAKFGLK